MPRQKIHLIALALLAASPAVAQERVRTAVTIDLRDVLQQVQVATKAAEHAVAVTLPVALAGVEPALTVALPAALASVEPALTVALPAALASVEPAVHAATGVALSSLGNLSFAFDEVDFPEFSDLAPAPWAPQDPADSLYRAARRALNEQEYARAAQLFSRIHDEARFRGSEYRAISFYYEALARQRMGGLADLRQAKSSLEQMRSQHDDVWRDQRDAAALLARVNAELARQGDARAAVEVRERGNTAAQGACTDQNMVVKVEALNALLQMDAESALPILEEVMKKRGTDECTVELRRKAVFLISQKRSDRSAELLLQAAKSDPDPRVQEQAVFWLSQVGGDRAVSAIEDVLRSSTDRKVQERAIFALSQHRSARAAELLRDYALRTDIPDELRGNAIFWIGQHRGADNARFLIEIYPRIDSREVKEKVIFSLSQIRSDESADWLLARALDQSEPVEIRKNALFWAGQQRALPIAKLNELYDKMPSREMKGQLVFVLSQRQRDPEAVELLIKIAQTEKDPEIRKNAIFWLGQSKDPRAAKFLLDLIKS